MDSNYNVLTDDELLSIAKEGSEIALEKLVLKYDDRVNLIASTYISKVNDPTIDNDVIIQEGRMGLIDAIKSYDGDKGASFKTYSITCITNRVINAVKKETKRKVESLPLDDEEAFLQVPSNINIEEDVLLNELFDGLMSKSNSILSDYERMVLGELIKGMEYKEIALKFDKSPKSIDNTIQRIKKKLREYLKK